jgi:phosphonopyruvate decarboxylase
MLQPNEFCKFLKSLKYNFFSGVPCSFLGGLTNYMINKNYFLMSTNEGEAVSICVGAALSKKKSVLLIQNSGLTNAMSPLTSLAYTFKVPILGFVGFRGEKKINDEPQHRLVGNITIDLLKIMQIKWSYLSSNTKIAKKQLIKADNYIRKNKSYFFIVKNKTFQNVKLKKFTKNINNSLKIKKKLPIKFLFKREDVLRRIISQKCEKTAILCTTGKTGRELHDINDSENNFYMVGSMGNVSSIGLGIALSNNKKMIIAIDGDGALLMKMGNLATNGFYSPPNLFHLLLDNNCHDSTGGQFTVSDNVNFVNVAANCGYKKSLYIPSLEKLAEEIKEWKKNPSLTFAYMRILPGSLKNLGRPSLEPTEVKSRFMNFLKK